MKTVFISVPDMSPEAVESAKLEVLDQLNSQNEEYHLINPDTTPVTLNDFSNELHLLAMADEVIFAKGWEISTICREEKHMCDIYNKKYRLIRGYPNALQKIKLLSNDISVLGLIGQLQTLPANCSIHNAQPDCQLAAYMNPKNESVIVADQRICKFIRNESEVKDLYSDDTNKEKNMNIKKEEINQNNIAKNSSTSNEPISFWKTYNSSECHASIGYIQDKQVNKKFNYILYDKRIDRKTAPNYNYFYDTESDDRGHIIRIHRSGIGITNFGGTIAVNSPLPFNTEGIYELDGCQSFMVHQCNIQ